MKKGISGPSTVRGTKTGLFTQKSNYDPLMTSQSKVKDFILFFMKISYISNKRLVLDLKVQRPVLVASTVQRIYDIALVGGDNIIYVERVWKQICIPSDAGYRFASAPFIKVIEPSDYRSFRSRFKHGQTVLMIPFWLTNDIGPLSPIPFDQVKLLIQKTNIHL